MTHTIQPITPAHPMPATEDRITALELLLQNIVLLLEAEPDFTADALARWMQTAMQHMRAHSAATDAELAALARLVGKVSG